MTESPSQTPGSQNPGSQTPGSLATDASTGVDTATFAEGHVVRVKKLQRQLSNSRKWSLKATRDLHRAMLKDVKDAERRAKKAEKRATEAEKRLADAQRRARRAEAELDRIKASSTWKAGRAVVAVPARIKRWRS